MNEDPRQAALPKLYGAPAYARPPVAAAQPVDRPFDPDDLPLAAELTPEERELAGELVARPYSGGGASEPAGSPGDEPPMLRARPFRLRAIGNRLTGGGRTRR